MGECKRCGQCCVNPTVTINIASEDVAKFYQGFGIEVRRNGDKFMAVFYTGTVCRHLRRDEDNLCSCAIYEQRPEMCRNYPVSLADTHKGCGLDDS